MTDPFDNAFALLAAAADVPGCKARIGELRRQLDEIGKAQARLDADRASAAADKAADDTREKALREREIAVAIGERNLSAGLQQLAADRRAMAPRPGFDPNFGPGSVGPGGITREAYSE
jgi:hypothetical protein